MNSQHLIEQFSAVRGSNEASPQDPLHAAKERLSSAITRILAGDASAALEAEQAQRHVEHIQRNAADPRTEEHPK